MNTCDELEVGCFFCQHNHIINSEELGRQVWHCGNCEKANAVTFDIEDLQSVAASLLGRIEDLEGRLNQLEAIVQP